MSKSLYKAVSKGARVVVSEEDRWFQAEIGIVADNKDPDRQHRVRVTVPSIDENIVWDDWARQMVICMGNGYGSVFIPPVGSEVLLFGGLGQKYNLFYASLYNEEMQIAEDFEDETVSGFRLPGDMKLIAELDAQLRAGRISIEADSQINLVAPGGLFINGRKIA